MKIVCLTTMISALLFFTYGIQAQITDAKLDQMELMKQFSGNWKCEIAKDTIEYADFKYVTKDKIFLEGKQLYGYDRQMDKFIASVKLDGFHRFPQICAHL